jgi:TolA-binding protein
MNEDDDVLRELGNQLPWDRPDDARREAVRSSLLDAASAGDDRVRTRWSVVGGAFAAGAVAAAAVILLVSRGGGDHAAVQPQAQIEASSSADFERHVTHTPRGGTDEIVRLHGGKVSLAVGALPIGDRVRVATRDAEVEGEGSYDVIVVRDEIREVTVAKGRATVRVAGQQAVFLAAGETWKAPVITASADLVPSAPSPVAHPNASDPASDTAPTASTNPTASVNPTASANPTAGATPTTRPNPSSITRLDPSTTQTGQTSVDVQVADSIPTATPSTSSNRTTDAHASSATATPHQDPIATNPAPEPVQTPKDPQTPTEKHFRAGWQLLKAGKAAEAARELGAAADAGGDDPLAADARYFQAVALIKAGRKTEAEHALVAFLDHAQHALRRGRAAVMLARLIAERGDAKSARAWFESAVHDEDAGVASAAKAGLDALRE